MVVLIDGVLMVVQTYVILMVGLIGSSDGCSDICYSDRLF